MTAIILFLPLTFWTYNGAYLDGVFNTADIVISLVGGVVIMAYPVVLIKTKRKFN